MGALGSSIGDHPERRHVLAQLIQKLFPVAVTMKYDLAGISPARDMIERVGKLDSRLPRHVGILISQSDAGR